MFNWLFRMIKLGGSSSQSYGGQDSKVYIPCKSDSDTLRSYVDYHGPYPGYSMIAERWGDCTISSKKEVLKWMEF